MLWFSLAIFFLIWGILFVVNRKDDAGVPVVAAGTGIIAFVVYLLIALFAAAIFAVTWLIRFAWEAYPG